MSTAAVLSRREAEVAPLLVFGKTKKEAANDLCRSVVYFTVHGIESPQKLTFKIKAA